MYVALQGTEYLRVNNLHTRNKKWVKSDVIVNTRVNPNHVCCAQGIFMS